jgi:hypothetical protein
MSAFKGKVTCRLHCEMSAYDPRRTSQVILLTSLI